MRNLIYVLTLLLIVAACDKNDQKYADESLQQVAVVSDNNFVGDPPAATVPLDKVTPVPFKSVEVDPASLSPAYVSGKLKIGESLFEDKLGHVPATPPAGDILVMFDLTGSMGGELNNAKNNAQNIMTNVRNLIPDTYFGLISHKDYPGYYSGCGYGNYYGGATDFPYFRNQPLTYNTADVATAIGAMSVGGGSDGPESYVRALYETVNDVNIGWRSGSKKIVVAILDNIPHDCDVYAILGSYGTTTGPSQSGQELLNVIQDMADNNITLIVLYSGAPGINFQLWDALANETGGVAFQINSNGTIPGGSDIQTTVVNLIEEEVSSVDELTLEVCTPGYEDWLAEVVPASYTDVDLPFDADFDITLTVPEGTVDGVHIFDVCLVGDGVVYARQTVEIEVYSTIEVPFDYHPTSCPNPLNRNSKGVIPMAILGTEDFDVSDINPETILIEGFSPVRWALEDVSTPYMPYLDKPLDAYACNTYEGDGFMDLTLKFDAQEISSLFALNEVGDVVKITITGKLYDDTEFVGEDVIIIKK